MKTRKIVKNENKRKRQGGGGKRAGRGDPRSPEQRGILKMLAARTQNANAEVYNLTNQKFAKDIDKILKKCGEEATEIVIAAKNPNAEELKYEIADFLYHMSVLMVECKVDWEDIVEELSKR